MICKSPKIKPLYNIAPTTIIFSCRNQHHLTVEGGTFEGGTSLDTWAEIWRLFDVGISLLECIAFCLKFGIRFFAERRVESFYLIDRKRRADENEN